MLFLCLFVVNAFEPFISLAESVNRKNSFAEIYYDKAKDKEDSDNTAEANKNTAEQLLEDIQEVNDRIAETSATIEEMYSDLADLDAEIEQSENDILDTEEAVKEEREILSGALAQMYETTGSEDFATQLSKATSESDLINREEYVTSIGIYINEKIGTLEDLIDEKEDQNRALILLQDERQEQLEEYETKQTELSGELLELTELMYEAEQKAEDAEAFSAELADEVAELEALERQLLENRTYYGESSGVVYDGDGTDYYYVTPYSYTEDELKILAAIIQCEAGTTSYPGMIAVGSVVMNRVESESFPNTIEGVVYAPYQFEPVSTGTFAVTLAQGPADVCYQAAREVLEGKRNVPNYYFKAAWYAEEHGISGVNIGGNVFH